MIRVRMGQKEENQTVISACIAFLSLPLSLLSRMRCT